MVAGGFPANFDHSGVSVADEKIALTRALMLSGIIQAKLLVKHYNFEDRQNFMLDPYLQQAVGQAWLALGAGGFSFTEAESAKVADIDWILNNSGGNYQANEFLKDISHHLWPKESASPTLSKDSSRPFFEC